MVEKHGESYIDRMMLDDKPLTKYRILHNELLKGGTYFELQTERHPYILIRLRCSSYIPGSQAMIFRS